MLGALEKRGDSFAGYRRGTVRKKGGVERRNAKNTSLIMDIAFHISLLMLILLPHFLHVFQRVQQILPLPLFQIGIYIAV